MSLQQNIRRLLETATAHRKCHPCGCYQDAVTSLRESEIGADLDGELAEASEAFLERQYDCLGCEICWPADALNLAADLIDLPVGEGCAAGRSDRRPGWPPYAGNYRVLRYGATVAVCTLHSRDLVETITASDAPGLSIVGSLQTENLGIERLVENVVSNPNIRHLLLCGEDTPGEVGHFPGQSLRALVDNGLDERGRIIGATGRRPVLKNIDRKLVEYFRRQVRVLDRRGSTDPVELKAAIEQSAAQGTGPLDGPVPSLVRRVPVIRASRPGRLVRDPAGYVVIQVDRPRRLLVAEHYRNDGRLQTVYEGSDPMEVVAALLEGEAVTRLDHAAYLGRQLTRAHAAMEEGTSYVQDRAPGESECSACGCGPPEEDSTCE